jgi:hydroxyethylthiazole kinase
MIDQADTDLLNPWESLQCIRRIAPVVHSITNYVVMNNTANALLALGASPVMAHAEEEMAEMVALSAALVLNIGTLSPLWIRSMFVAAEHAQKRGIPIVIDPVGAGATTYRTSTARELIKAARPCIIRGNASEIMAVCRDGVHSKGVDSQDPAASALSAAQSLHQSFGSTVCISGETDHVVGDAGLVKVRNGHPMMTRVTGLGCTASALCGAFAAVEPDPMRAAAKAMIVMGVAGEIAAEGASGPGTLQVRFLDALYRLTAEDLHARMRLGA